MIWFLILLIVVFIQCLVVIKLRNRFSKSMAAIQWFFDHSGPTAAVLQEAYIIRSVPDHSNVFTRSGNDVLVGSSPDQQVIANFNTLKEMLWLMIDMESERRTAVMRMGKSLDALAAWEHEHPFPLELPPVAE